MANIVLQGLTWDHRRAIDPLLATVPGFRAKRPDVDIVWTPRPLQAFEFAPVPELAKQYDLIVLDHPFMGDITASRCLEPLDGTMNGDSDTSFIGPSLESYRYQGNIWALPIDAACQVAVVRPDLLATLARDVPSTWDEMFDLGSIARGHGQSLAIGLKGVHSLMTFFTLCANLGEPCGVSPAERLFEIGTARVALATLRRLLTFCPIEALDWNSIELHDQMVIRNDLVYCPAVYCYATYAESDVMKPLRFHDLPGVKMPTPVGSTIGGTGLGISAHSKHTSECFEYVSYLAEIATQKAFAAHHGQPARLEAWLDPAIDQRFGGCYSKTLKTMEGAWIRPRYPGYLTFQASAGELIECHLRGSLQESELLGSMARLWRSKDSQA